MEYQAVTVFKNSGTAWEQIVFDKAYVRHIKAVDRENGGNRQADVMTVRIFSQSAISINTEDKIVEGKGYTALPENALTVSEIADNRCLRRGHIRVTAR